MTSSDPNPDSLEDTGKTVLLKESSPSELLRDNAGRLLGEMLNNSLPGLERAGDQVGPYRLCELLGEGGFGNVWRAEQTQVVKREVAIKVIKLGMDTVQVLGRFDQERQALASLDHPSIATMLDAGVSPDGRPYFAMELVRGGPVTAWCEERALSIPDRLRLFIQICHAVHHAHEKGLLHRDLKPGNILITEIAGQPVPKVIDFGIAKALSTGADPLTLLTQAGQIIGTPIYMSPEQIQSGTELDPRSDVYALGVLLYQLLTGVTPFETTATSGAVGMEGLKRLILETVPERPSTRLRRQTAAHKPRQAGFHGRLSLLPADLDWITLRALEKDRGQRYPSAAEFAADVRRYLAGEPVHARRPSLWYAARRGAFRHRKPLIASCLGAVLGTGLIMLASRTTSPPPPAAPPSTRYPVTLTSEDAGRESFTNSLGMKFIPVAGTNVMFCLHETRFKDYAAYAATVTGIDEHWRQQQAEGVAIKEKAEEHPVTHVNRSDALAFCAWLSQKEGRTYRLPTDQEWSCAAAVGALEDWTPDTTPESVTKDDRSYPWGGVWPPQWRAGNYSDMSRQAKSTTPPAGATYVLGYDDGYPTTAPVMSSGANRLGLFDLGGNVSEWVAEAYTQAQTMHVLRGASWTTSDAAQMLSSHRQPQDPGTRDAQSGFRCVLAPGAL